MLALDLLYILGALLIGPLYLLARVFKRKPLASPLQRLGFVDPVLDDGRDVVWVHGVSVGEVLAARALVGGLDGAHVVVTSTTVTGLEVAVATYPDCDVRSCPYDLSFAVRRFVAKVRPRVLVLMELELWPNMLAVCRRAGVPVVVANGKVSEGSGRGYRQIQRLFPNFLDGIGAFLMQNREYADRLGALGVPESRIEVVGNLKYANVTFDTSRPTRTSLRGEHGFDGVAPIAIFGSTHAGEEGPILEACAAVAAAVEGFRAVLVPRHPERVPEVVRLVERAGLRVGLRSRRAEVRDPTCLVVDTMGELSSLYGLADVAFVGGTLVDVGGHNLLEPAGMGLPLVVGPHLHTVQDAASELTEAGVLEVVSGADALADALIRLLSDSEARASVVSGARSVFARHKGSAQRTISVLTQVLRSSKRHG
ncbi:MAG: glycosyltransferase N-terminal domain-containing protein [Planctomycetota bacterium]|nr:glycosyltransferase N-terminal domain-containing protein [Planctomycetota bacterium]